MSVKGKGNESGNRGRGEGTGVRGEGGTKEWKTVERSGARICKRLWSPGIDTKASIPPAYVAWRAGTITLFLLGA